MGDFSAAALPPPKTENRKLNTSAPYATRSARGMPPPALPLHHPSTHPIFHPSNSRKDIIRRCRRRRRLPNEPKPAHALKLPRHKFAPNKFTVANDAFCRLSTGNLRAVA